MRTCFSRVTGMAVQIVVKPPGFQRVDFGLAPHSFLGKPTLNLRRHRRRLQRSRCSPRARTPKEAAETLWVKEGGLASRY